MTAPRSVSCAHPVAAALRTGLLVAALVLVVGAHLAGIRAVPVLTGSMAPYAPAVMHRVASTSDTAQGRAMTTRGDANAHDDPWTVALDGADLGRAVVVVPLAGRAAMAGPAAVLSLLAGAAALLVGVRLLRRPVCACAPHRAAQRRAAPRRAAPRWSSTPG